MYCLEITVPVGWALNTNYCILLFHIPMIYIGVCCCGQIADVHFVHV